VCVGVGQRPSESLGEDCLFINVFKPTNATADFYLPVWLFIQGGGYADNSNANFNGSKVVQRSGHNIVFVNFNYRVGALGFLASEDVRKDGDLNAGLLDQRKVLHWVQKHIRQFGGDPNHVIVHGDSAGAGSAAYHMAAYGGRDDNLFVGAVAQSTFWPTQRAVAEMEFQYNQFAQDVGCNQTINTLSCLRSAPIETIQKANVNKPFPQGSSAPSPLWYFLPVIDGDLIRGRLYRSFEEGRVIQVPLMVGDVTNEGTSFAYNASTASEVAQFLKNNYPQLTAAELATISQQYGRLEPLPGHAEYFHTAATAYGHSTFICPGNHMAASLARHSSPRMVWNWRFNVQDPTQIAQGLGVPHVFDMNAIFGTSGTNEAVYSYDASNADIIPVTMNYYISFVRALDPNPYRSNSAPEWRPWASTSGMGRRIKLETNSTQMENIPEVQRQRCSMWKDLAVSMQH
jgi:acetylcholinesterase